MAGAASGGVRTYGYENGFPNRLPDSLICENALLRERYFLYCCKIPPTLAALQSGQLQLLEAHTILEVMNTGKLPAQHVQYNLNSIEQ
jgi:hypothetical protein